MPTYQYACTECGHSFEQFQSFSDDALTECPECTGRLRKLFSAVGVVFKGSGFYRTDSRAPSTSESGSSESSSGKSDKSDGKSDATAGGKSSEKPAAKPSEKSGTGSGSGSGTGSSSSTSPAPASS